MSFGYQLICPLAVGGKMSTFKLGKKSLQELDGVHADLVAVVKRAIEITVQDFAVHDGIRTLKEQQRLVQRGSVYAWEPHFNSTN